MVRKPRLGSATRHTLKMIAYWSRRNPRLRVCLENPRGYMRHMPELAGLHRTTVRYADHGWPIDKATDRWTNFPLALRPRPRRSPTVGRVGAPGWRQAMRIPPPLVRELLTRMAAAAR